MKIQIDWDSKEVWVGIDDGWDAGVLGFEFGVGFPELAEAGWNLWCHTLADFTRASATRTAVIHTSRYISGRYRAGEIARLIEAGQPSPPKPKHDCPGCDCEPECCN